MDMCKNINFYRRMRDARIKKIRNAGPFLKGSLVKIPHTCGNKNCRCARGEKHQSYYLTYKAPNRDSLVQGKAKQKTKTMYIPVDLVEEVKQWTEEYKRIKHLMEEVTELQKIIIRRYVKEKSARKRNRLQ